MEQRLEGKVAIVTGAGQGIGRGIALRLAREGATVVVAELNPDTAAAVAAEIRDMGRPALAYSIDLTNVDQVQSMVDRVVEEYDRVDILVNNAGRVQVKPLLDVTEGDWDAILDINLKGLFFCLQAVAAQMVRQLPEDVPQRDRADRCHGKIVNMTSISGRHGRSDQVHYAASKMAIISVTQSAALALARYGINVNAVSPSVVATPMWDTVDRDRGRIAGLKPGEAMSSFVERIPLKRAGTPEDMAAAVAFLCSSDADYITGQTLNVDGGFEMN